MKKLLLTIPLLALIACNETTEAPEDNNSAEKNTEEIVDSKEERIETDESLIDIGVVIEGEWIGDFGGKQLTIVIEDAEDGILTGYNIVSGNKRKITGTVIRNGELVKVELREPGDDKWDGIFYSEFNLSKIALTGNWKSNNGKLTTPFDLSKSSKGVDNRIVGKYIIEAIPYTNIVINADRTCSLTEIDMETMGEEDANEDISLKGSWYSSGDKVTIEWWGSYFGAKKTILTYQRHEGQGPVEAQELLVFGDDEWFVYKIE